MKPIVSIIVLNWNGKEYTKQCIESVAKHTARGKYELIVVDNGSKDGSIEMLEGMKRRKIVDTIILNSENRGFSGANNQGMKISRGKFIFLLNNDTLLEKNWLEKMVKVAETDAKIGIVGPHLPESKTSKKIYGGGYIDDRGIARHSYNRHESDAEQVGGAALLIKRKVFEKIGFLDEGFNPIYFEESDYCARARRSGYRIVFTPEVKIVHFGSKIVKKQASKWSFVTLNKNRVRYMLLHFSKKRLLKALGWELARIAKHTVRLRIHWLLEAYWINLKNLGDIIGKRRKYSRGLLKVRA
ncbi:MAG: glycosyltransferase family 2 protein [Candidatus Diapherotrites archaeon]|nr:glycosyltransferase family 2 protein [Candidatus Diapherotrites archaeon]